MTEHSIHLLTLVLIVSAVHLGVVQAVAAVVQDVVVVVLKNTCANKVYDAIALLSVIVAFLVFDGRKLLRNFLVSTKKFTRELRSSSYKTNQKHYLYLNATALYSIVVANCRNAKRRNS